MTLDEYFTITFAQDLALTPRTDGAYALHRMTVPAGQPLPMIPTTLSASLYGLDYRTAKLEHPSVYYELIRGNRVIMSSIGVEMFRLYTPYCRARGRVLLGGLGVGALARLVCDKPEVEQVTVIELSGEVIRLCGFDHPKVTIIQGDFYEFIRTEDLKPYDYMYFDTFSEGTDLYETVILPMREFLLDKYPAANFDFWNENELMVEYALAKGLVKGE